MGYVENDLQMKDVMWFAVDKNGYIAAFFSNEYDNLPEFVRISQENNEKLYDYFMYYLYDSTCGDLLATARSTEQEEDCVLLIGKGIICFDALKHNDYYSKLATTRNPITLDALDAEIKGILKNYKLDVDFLADDTINI